MTRNAKLNNARAAHAQARRETRRAFEDALRRENLKAAHEQYPTICPWEAPASVCGQRAEDAGVVVEDEIRRDQ